MEVLGFRKKGIALLDYLLLMTGIPFIVLGILEIGDFFVYTILGSLIVIYSIFELIVYYSIPRKAIVLLDKDTISFGRTKVYINHIVNVSYKRPISIRNSITYRFGKIIITTAYEKYEINYIENCEDVCNRLKQLVDDKRNERAKKI